MKKRKRKKEKKKYRPNSKIKRTFKSLCFLKERKSIFLFSFFISSPPSFDNFFLFQMIINIVFCFLIERLKMRRKRTTQKRKLFQRKRKSL